MIKYATAHDIATLDSLECFLYAQTLKAISQLRSDDYTLWKETDGEYSRVSVADYSDAELTPENGFYILGHCPPVMGNLQTNKGHATRVTSTPMEIVGGGYGVAMKVSWTARTRLPASKLTSEQATALNATLTTDEYCYIVPAYPFDFTAIVNTYTGSATITDTEPEWQE